MILIILMMKKIHHDHFRLLFEFFRRLVRRVSLKRDGKLDCKPHLSSSWLWKVYRAGKPVSRERMEYLPTSGSSLQVSVARDAVPAFASRFPRALDLAWKFRKMRRAVRASVVHRAPAWLSRWDTYLTLTASPSKEVRKAIFRHRSDVLQIAAIYFATSNISAHRVLGARNFHFALSRRYIIYRINQLINHF